MRDVLDVWTPAHVHDFLAVQYLTVLGVDTFGDDRGAMLEPPPQQCLGYCLAMLSCNAGNCLVLHCMPFLLQLDWSPWMVAAMSSNTVMCHKDMHCCMSFALLHVFCTVACHLHCCMLFATPDAADTDRCSSMHSD